MSLPENQNSNEKDESEVRVILFGKSDPAADKISTYLKRKDFIVIESYNLNDFLNKLSNSQFDAAFVSVDVLQGNLLKLPGLLLKAFNLESIAIALSNDRKEQGKLRQIVASQKVHGLASGMGCFTALKKLFAPKDEDSYSQSSGSKTKSQSSSIKVSGGGSLKEQMIMQRNQRSKNQNGDESVKKQLLKMAQSSPDSAIQNKAQVQKSISDNETKSAHASGQKTETNSTSTGATATTKPDTQAQANTSGAKKKNIEKEMGHKSESNNNIESSTGNINKAISDSKNGKKNQPSAMNKKPVEDESKPQLQSSDKTQTNVSDPVEGNKKEQGNILSEKNSTKTATAKNEGPSSKNEVVAPENEAMKSHVSPIPSSLEEALSENAVGEKNKPHAGIENKERIEAENKPLSSKEMKQFLFSILVKKEGVNELYFVSIDTNLNNKNDRSEEIRKILTQDIGFKSLQYISELSLDKRVSIGDYSLGLNERKVETMNGERNIKYTDKVETINLPKIINEQMALIDVENIPTDSGLSFSLFLYLENNMKYYRLLKPKNRFSVDLKTRLMIADKSVYIQTDEIKSFYKDFCLSMYAKIHDPSVQSEAA